MLLPLSLPRDRYSVAKTLEACEARAPARCRRSWSGPSARPRRGSPLRDSSWRAYASSYVAFLEGSHSGMYQPTWTPALHLFAVLAVSSFVRRSLSGQSFNRKQSEFLACVLEQRKKVKRVAAAEVRRQARVAQAARQAEVSLPTVFSKSRNLSRCPDHEKY